MSLAHGAEDTAEMIRRVVEMEKLYIQDGRDKRDHPLHGTFTGLASKDQKSS
jgi:hypothetical protein